MASTLTTQQRNAYRAGWNASGGGKASRVWDSLDAAEDDYLSRGRTSAQHDAWVAGWIDYASDYDYGHALVEMGV